MKIFRESKKCMFRGNFCRIIHTSGMEFKGVIGCCFTLEWGFLEMCHYRNFEKYAVMSGVFDFLSCYA